MKVLAASLAVLLLVAICSSVGASPQKPAIPTSCCFSYTSLPVPRSVISSAYMTSKMCSQPAVVLVTKKGRSICANPEEPWVQKYLKDLETLES